MSDIDHLAGLVGIENGYWDLAGQWHATPVHTKAALLAGLRLDADDAEAIEAAAYDLPTVRGWFQAQDILWRERLGLYPGPESVAAARAERAHEAGLLLDRLRSLSLLGHGEDEAARTLALHRYHARSASTLAAVQLDDLADEIEQPNLPGTVFEHPNWRRRYRYSVDEVAEGPLAAPLLAAMAIQRPR